MRCVVPDLIIQAAELLDTCQERLQDVRVWRATLVVSRVAPGKLWFLHSTGRGKRPSLDR